MMRTRHLLLGALLAVAAATAPAQAQTVIEEWGTAKFPAAPPLKPAKIVAAETAVLVMDFTKQTCTPERRKRCADSVPHVVKFITEARAKGALIIYSVAVPNSVAFACASAFDIVAGKLRASCRRESNASRGSAVNT